jgi:hypothetical protein
MARIRERLTYANVMATIAVFTALGAGAYAAGLPKNSVKAKQIKAGAVGNSELASDAVTSDKVADGSLLGADFAAGQLPQGPRGEQGLQGERGIQGEQGIQGVEGTARAYAHVHPQDEHACSPTCTIDHAKGVSQVTDPGNGTYCVRVPGVSPADVSPIAAGEYGSSILNVENAIVAVDTAVVDCPTKSDFEVRTYARGSTSVRNAADTGSVNVASNSPTLSNDVAFTIVIP